MTLFLQTLSVGWTYPQDSSVLSGEAKEAEDEEGFCCFNDDCLPGFCDESGENHNFWDSQRNKQQGLSSKMAPE